MLKVLNKALLIIVEKSNPPRDVFEEDLREMKELAESAQSRVMGFVQANLPHPSPSTYLREGKLKEVGFQAKTAGANVLYFNVDLTPVQARNIEKEIQVKAVDRTGLILEIFGRRARSNEGKLQVELARLNYLLPRIGGLGGVLSRLGGGIGTRGPGEQELEWDRRKIRRRIQWIKKDLEKVRKHRQLIRSGRKRKHFWTAALVGYTNAGKSTLLNALTGADAYVEDKLFATLDPQTRIQNLNGGSQVLLIDTVGFIRDLPHTLVEAFQATLEEVSEADLLIHVLDASSRHAAEYKRSVEKVLEEIHADGTPQILALNKADLMDEDWKKIVSEKWPQGILISAKQRLGLQGLLSKLEASLQEEGLSKTE